MVAFRITSPALVLVLHSLTLLADAQFLGHEDGVYRRDTHLDSSKRALANDASCDGLGGQLYARDAYPDVYADLDHFLIAREANLEAYTDMHLKRMAPGQVHQQHSYECDICGKKFNSYIAKVHDVNCPTHGCTGRGAENTIQEIPKRNPVGRNGKTNQK